MTSFSAKERTINKKIIKLRKLTDKLNFGYTVSETFLAQSGLPSIEDIQTDNLPNILEDFYPSFRKQIRLQNTDNKDTPEVDDDDPNLQYKTSTLKCIRAGLN